MRAATRTRFAVIAFGAAIGLGLASDDTPAPPAPIVDGSTCGVDQLRIQRTARGNLLDLRYRIVDPARASSLLAKHATAYLVHARTGRRLDVPSTPKAGALRATGTPQEGRTYFALFSNPGGLVQAGDRVTVVLGDLAVDLAVL